VMVAELLADTRESRRRSAAAMGAATTAAAAVTAAGAPRLSAASRHARLAGHHAETLRSLSRPAQGPALWARDPLPAIKKPAKRPRKKPPTTAKAA
jgi:hypothetical protein